jgi:hypothetical protein
VPGPVVCKNVRVARGCYKAPIMILLGILGIAISMCMCNIEYTLRCIYIDMLHIKHKVNNVFIAWKL